MSGWTRLKIVLSVAYWAVAALFLFAMQRTDPGDSDLLGETVGMLFLAGIPYLFVCALVWAIQGIAKPPTERR